MTTWVMTWQALEETSSITWQTSPSLPPPPPPTHDEDEDIDRIDEQCIQGMITWWFRREGSFPQCPPDTMIAGNMEQFTTLLAEAGPGLDMCELCGGEARATTVAVRRRLKTGENFDLVTHVDLNDPKVQ